jgi:16S rRNA (guanine1207-N2)-methyltransferase
MLQSFITDLLHCSSHEHVVILNSAADPSIARLAQQLVEGELLLAEDSLAAARLARQAVQQAGRSALRLREVAFHEYTLHEAAATMDTAILNILYQPNNAWMHYAIQLAAYALKPGGQLYVEGAKDRGILSLGKRVQEVFGNLETLKISKGQRVISALKGPQTRVAEISAPNVVTFAGGKLDEGTMELIAALSINATDVALDLGCGSGFIGAHIAEQAPQGQVTMVDVSRASVGAARALITERGLTNVRVLESDGVQALEGQRFDLIATNPPFHLGGIQTTSIAERFIREAAQVLQAHGRFYLVANRFLKYEPVLRSHFSSITEVGGNPRFKVLLAQGPMAK